MKKIMTILALIFIISTNAQKVPSAGEVYNRVQVQPMQNTINSINNLPTQTANRTTNVTSNHRQTSHINDFMNQHGINPRSNSPLCAPGQWSPSLQREIILRNGRNFNDNRVIQFQNNEIIVTPY